MRSYKHPNGWDIIMGLLVLLLLMASTGDGDYQDALERENRDLKSQNATLRQAVQAPRQQAGEGLGRGS